MAEYEIVPPFDEELNKRVAAASEPYPTVPIMAVGVLTESSAHKAIAEAARSEEREACAKLCDELKREARSYTDFIAETAGELAERIRARGKKSNGG